MEATTVETIRLILAPAVMLTACALFLNSFSARYGTLTSGLRALSRERLDLVHRQAEAKRIDGFDLERLQQIDAQLPQLLRHHRALHGSIWLLYITSVIFLASMFTLAGAAITNALWPELLALIIFLLGLVALLWTIAVTAIDFHDSHCVVQNEVKRNCHLRS